MVSTTIASETLLLGRDRADETLRLVVVALVPVALVNDRLVVVTLVALRDVGLKLVTAKVVAKILVLVALVVIRCEIVAVVMVVLLKRKLPILSDWGIYGVVEIVFTPTPSKYLALKA